MTNVLSYCVAVATLMIPSLHCVAGSKMNVLFLVADDMRPQFNAYLGADFPSPVHPKMYTPNLDDLASRSLLLKRAYVQQALCSPSRTSFLTGRRPDTTHIYDIGSYFREVSGNFTTLPQYFKEHGYHTVGIGKVFHPGNSSGDDDPPSWSEPSYHAPYLDYWYSKDVSWRAVKKNEMEDKPLPENDVANHAKKTLQRLAPNALSGNRPFFVAVGFDKPHLPFVFPDDMLQYYPIEDIKLPPNPYAPDNMPIAAWSDNIEIMWYGDIKKLPSIGEPNSTLPDDVVLKLRRAYYSTLTYVDDMIGKVITELHELGLANSTIISFLGDHGYQLGEHGEWTKLNNFELSTHVPLMIHIPGVTDAGIVSEQLVELVDVYPTLVEAASLPPLPLCPAENPSQVTACREGTSMLPLINNPDAEWKTAAFSQFPRFEFGHLIMGYTMRTDRYRYTEWVEFDTTNFEPEWDQLNATELYDHEIDPEENKNRSDDREYQSICQYLKDKLHLGWRDVKQTSSTALTP